MKITRLATTMLIVLATGACTAPTPTHTPTPAPLRSTLPSPTQSPAADPIGLGFVNATDMRVSLVVNGVTVRTFEPHGADKAIRVSALSPLPWAVEVRATSGRVLVTMAVSAAGLWTEAGADLSCGQIYLWSGPTEPPWPAPGSGSPGDCIP